MTALAMVSLVAAFSFARLFDSHDPALAAVTIAAWSHLVAAVGTKRRIPWPVIAPAGVLLLATWFLVPETSAYGVPTASSLSTLGSRLVDGVRELRRAQVPLPDDADASVLVALAAGVMALIGHVIAFRFHGVLSALVPALTVFTLTASLGTDRGQVALTAAMVAAALTFVLVRAPGRAPGDQAWFRVGTARRRSAVIAGLPLIAVASIAAPLLGPRLPEARSAGLVEWAGNQGEARTRVTVSPLVDIRRRLTSAPPVEVFRVEADAPAYWRMAALETYDGSIWSSLADYRSASGTLPADTAVAPTRAVTQRYEISNLAQFWLPAAYRPVSIDLEGARVNPASLTLLTERATADGLTYTVESLVPAYGPSDFAASTSTVPDEIAEFTALPGDVPASIRELARDVTSGATNPYERAMRLQRFFRDNFSYVEEVPAGHSDDRMVDFLFTHRAGYCEQFASSFAVMARTLGIPARVAVGFTPGTRAGTQYVVTSAEAHAWPEVYIDPLGWVAFEPTPTRFHPSSENHTGTFDPTAAPELPSTIDQPGTGRPASEPPPTAPPPRPDPVTDPELPSPERRGPWQGFALALLGVSGAAAARLLLLRRRRAELLAGADARQAVEIAWRDVVDRLVATGCSIRRSSTRSEIAGGAPERVAEAVFDLAALADLAAYAPVAPGPADVQRAQALAATVVEQLDESIPASRRVRRALRSGP